MKKVYVGIVICLFMILSIFFLFRISFKVTDKEAFHIALEYIEVNEENIVLKKVKKDLSDRCYHITLQDEIYKYKIEIDMSTGSVLEYERKMLEKEHKVDQNYMEKEEAKKIALSHSNLKEEDVFIKKIELEQEDGIVLYEIKFIYNFLEYEYEIDATTGKILKYKQER